MALLLAIVAFGVGSAGPISPYDCNAAWRDAAAGDGTQIAHLGHAIEMGYCQGVNDIEPVEFYILSAFLDSPIGQFHLSNWFGAQPETDASAAGQYVWARQATSYTHIGRLPGHDYAKAAAIVRDFRYRQERRLYEHVWLAQQDCSLDPSSCPVPQGYDLESPSDLIETLAQDAAGELGESISDASIRAIRTRLPIVSLHRRLNPRFSRLGPVTEPRVLPTTEAYISTGRSPFGDLAPAPRRQHWWSDVFSMFDFDLPRSVSRGLGQFGAALIFLLFVGGLRLTIMWIIAVWRARETDRADAPRP